MPTINGTRWDDVVVSGSGAGYIRNGQFVASAANQSSASADIINTGNGDDYIEGAGGDDIINAGNGVDEVYGGDGADDIIGGNGSDMLDGGAGNDQLSGGTGDDTLTGGVGADTLTGGNGADTFVISAATESSAGASGVFNAATGDVITDFDVDQDTIDISGLDLTGDGAPVGLTFSGSVAAEYGLWTSVTGGNTTVFADVNGDAVADVSFQLSGVTNLDVSNIVGLGETSGETEVTAVNDIGTAVDAGVEAGLDAEGNVLTNDTDEGDTDLTVVGVRRGGETGSGQAGSVGLPLQGTYGTLILSADGSYTYIIDGSNASVQQLAEGQTLTETFTYVVANAEGDTDTAELTITIEGANDGPRIQSGADGGVAAVTVVEGDATVTDINAVDPDNNTTLTWSIVGGADADLFTIDEDTGVLTFNEAPDFDEPLDEDGDNVYEVEVQVDDGQGGVDTQVYAVTVVDEDTVVGDADDFDDTTTGPTGFTPTTGTAGSDSLGGGRGQDVLFGRDGDDRLNGGNANDILYGQAGDDTLVANDSEADLIISGDGDDSAATDNGDTSDAESVLS